MCYNAILVCGIDLTCMNTSGTGRLKQLTESTHMQSSATSDGCKRHITGSSIPKGLVIDGLDISKVLTDKGNRKNSDLLFLDGKQLQGYRSGQWKVKLPYKGFRGNKWKQFVKAHDTLLFNLNTDPGEKNNLFEKYPEKAKEILKEMIEKYQDMGKLPPSLITKTQADQSHFKKQ